MTAEKLNRGKEIEKRIENLTHMRKWFEDGERRIYVLASGCNMSDSIRISEDMRSVLFGMCMGEIAALEKEFEEL